MIEHLCPAHYGLRWDLLGQELFSKKDEALLRTDNQQLSISNQQSNG